MIIANIGNNTYMLNDLESATDLLRIIDESTEIREEYKVPGQVLYHEVTDRHSVQIAIVSRELTSIEEVERLVVEAQAKKEVKNKK